MMTKFIRGGKIVELDAVESTRDVADVISRIEIDGDELKVARLGRVEHILRNIDRGVVADLGPDYESLLNDMEQRLESGDPDNIPSILVDRLEGLFLQCQPYYNLTREQREKIRKLCEKHGVKTNH
jgi:hypothetical protein